MNYNGVPLFKKDGKELQDLEFLIEKSLPKVVTEGFGYKIDGKGIISVNLSGQMLNKLPDSLGNLNMLVFLDISHKNLTHILVCIKK